MIVWIIIGIIVLVLGYIVYIYNSIVTLRNKAESAWHDIEVQLKKRMNLIPNLVEIVRSYKDYEKDTLEKVIKARNQMLNSSDLGEKVEAAKTFLSGLGSFFAVAEAYPELKANEEYTSLKNALVNLEEDISNARMYYNAVIKDYNTAIEIFPNNIIAAKFRFTQLPYFEISESEKDEAYKTPKVEL